MRHRLAGLCAIPAFGLALTLALARSAAEDAAPRSADPPSIVAGRGLFTALTEPPCSYVSTQDRKGLVRQDDRVVAWMRGAHNGGAAPLRHFLALPRVLNDTYGLFFYDPDGGYVAVYAPGYGYEFHGWRRGVMVVRGSDGTLWSALSGRAIAGPRHGEKLVRTPSLATTWGQWLRLHPESTAYDLFDGRKYPIGDLPEEMSDPARASQGEVDPRLDRSAIVVGVEARGAARAFPIDTKAERACFTAEVGGAPVAVFWYGPTQSGTAFSSIAGGRTLSFYADEIAPESAPFMDRETRSRWTLAGRAVDGPLRGAELDWVDSVQCRWYAWAAEYPETSIHAEAK